MKIIKKIKSYYEYHGLFETLKAIIRKVFHIQNLSMSFDIKNDLE